MTDGEPKIVKLLAMDDKTVRDRVLYAFMAMRVLKMRQATFLWLNDGNKDYLCIIPTSLMNSKNIEELSELLKDGKYIDFTPNGERLGFLEIYRSTLRRYTELLREIKDNIVGIVEIINKNIEQMWKPPFELHLNEG